LIGLTIAIYQSCYITLAADIADDVAYCSAAQGFDRELPHRFTTLPFCNDFRTATCCNQTHLQAIAPIVSAFRRLLQDPSVPVTASEDKSKSSSNKCQVYAEQLLCYRCDPFFGTALVASVCLSSCETLYEACKQFLFTPADSSRLRPCQFSSLLCSRLDSVVSNGEEFCTQLGLPVENSAKHEDSFSAVDSVLAHIEDLRTIIDNTTDDESDVPREIRSSVRTCFDGRFQKFPFRVIDSRPNVQRPASTTSAFVLGACAATVVTLAFLYRRFIHVPGRRPTQRSDGWKSAIREQRVAKLTWR